MSKKEEKYLKLLKRYKKAITLLYDKGSSGDYTPDYMTYDYDGFNRIDTDVEEYLPELKNAVNKAELYIKYVTHKYTYTFS